MESISPTSLGIMCVHSWKADCYHCWSFNFKFALHFMTNLQLYKYCEDWIGKHQHDWTNVIREKAVEAESNSYILWHCIKLYSKTINSRYTINQSFNQSFIIVIVILHLLPSQKIVNRSKFNVLWGRASYKMNRGTLCKVNRPYTVQISIVCSRLEAQKLGLVKLVQPRELSRPEDLFTC